MKVTFDIDCTPEEARRFLGFPDLAPVHSAYVERMTRMIAHVVVPFTLVTWPGFAMRTEVQDWYRSLFGACKGIASAIRAGDPRA